MTLFVVVSISSCSKSADLSTVSDVELERYAGTWYEIARLPNRFEKGLECVSATYTLKENGKIEVLNQGRKVGEENKAKDIKGTAWVPDDTKPGQLKVRFFWPFAGDYYIIELDRDYRYALVGDPSRKFLWILARERSLDQAIIDSLLESAAAKGFDTEAVMKVNQDCS